jgi:hypothetical protein
MQIEHIMKIYSKEAYMIVKKITIGKKRHLLFDAAVYKIRLLLQLARQEQIYPLYKLFEVKQEMESLFNKISEEIEKLNTQFKLRQVNTDNFVFPLLIEVPVKFGNPIVFHLIELTESFDRLVCLQTLIKNTNPYINKKEYFSEKQQYQKMMFKFFSDLVRFPVKNLSRMSIIDFINSEQMQQVDANQLYLALNLIETPYIEATRYEMYIKIIKHKYLS